MSIAAANVTHVCNSGGFDSILFEYMRAAKSWLRALDGAKSWLFCRKTKSAKGVGLAVYSLGGLWQVRAWASADETAPPLLAAVARAALIYHPFSIKNI